MKTVRIKTPSQMLDFIKDSNLEVHEIKSLLEKAYGIYLTGKETKTEIINSLQSYFQKYQEGEKPLFLD